MSATLTKPQGNGREASERRLTREQAAEMIKELLTSEPQSEASIRAMIMGESHRGRGGSTDVVRGALGVLEARHEAMRLPNTAGSKQGGWIIYTAEQDSAKVAGQEEAIIKFPYQWGMVSVEDMFIDKQYQRPLTSFVDRIQGRFNPVLFQTLAVSDRGTKYKPKRYAVIDGQTRWVAATRLKITMVPCIIFEGLRPQDEAEIFADLQKERRGIISWHRFRAALAANKSEAHAIQKLVKNTGFVLGEEVGQLKAVAALEHCFRISPELLERVLTDLKAAWPKEVPETVHIRGLHYLFRHYPLEKKDRYRDIDDEKLVRRLGAAGPDGLKSKMHMAKASALEAKGSNEYWMAQAMQNVYNAGK